MKKVNKWIQKTGLKKGALSKQLGIPEEENLPKTFLRKIVEAKPRERVINPTKIGKSSVKVTRLMERRSIMALTLKAIAEKRKK